MKILLDTHIAIWALVEPERISAAGQALISEEANTILVSSASVWEIAIKFGLGRKGAPPFSGRDAVRYFNQAGYRLLPITDAHAAAIEDLPPTHGDPFDRMLLSQARCESAYLLTHDQRLAAFGDIVIAV